jgi:hypothetical protein
MSDTGEEQDDEVEETPGVGDYPMSCVSGRDGGG